MVEFVMIMLIKNKLFWVIWVSLMKLVLIFFDNCFIFFWRDVFFVSVNFCSEFVVLLNVWIKFMLGFIRYFNIVFFVWIRSVFVCFLEVVEIFLFVLVLFSIFFSNVILDRVFFVIRLFFLECVLIIWVKFFW